MHVLQPQDAARTNFVDDGVYDGILEICSLEIGAQSIGLRKAFPFFVILMLAGRLIFVWIAAEDMTSVNEVHEDLEMLGLMFRQINDPLLRLLPAATKNCLNKSGLLPGQSLMNGKRD